MNTTSIPPLYPPGGGSVKEQFQDSVDAFHSGEMVLMRSKRISKEEVKRFYDLYGALVPTDIWWSYIGKEYNKQIEYCKDADDDGAYYMFHTKYLGKIKQNILERKNSNDLFGQKMYIVEWEAREGTLFPGESLIRTQEHYAENLISLSKMTVMTKEEILDEVLKWALDNTIQKADFSTT